MSQMPLIIVQARMKSTRLPGKVLLPLLKEPMLIFLLRRLVFIGIPLVVATTKDSSDDPVCVAVSRLKIPFFRGSEEDVLDRYVHAMGAFSCDAVVRITADCPLQDPKIVQRAIDEFYQSGVDYLSNTIIRTFPRGYDVEVISKKALLQAGEEAKLAYEREHVTPFIIEHEERFPRRQFLDIQDRSIWRLTVDTQEDFELIKLVVGACEGDFSYKNVALILEKYPDWKKINEKVVQKVR